MNDFDQSARLSVASTGAEARGGTTADGPYHESFGYDVWGNMLDHDTRHWNHNYPMTATTYANDRHDGWTYDAAGNATQQATDTVFTFDAAGRLVSAYNPTYSEFCGTTGPQTMELTNVTTFDGDGETTKMAETRAINGPPGFTISKYYLRSTALGGEVIDLLTAAGVKQQGMVFADGGILAKQLKSGSTEKVVWEHTNPATGVIWGTDDTGTLLGREELDPLGANVGWQNPYTSGSGGGGGSGDCEGSHFQTPRPAANDVDGSCYLNGTAAPCGTVMDMLNHGAGTQVDLDKTDAWGRARNLSKKTAAKVEIGGNFGKTKGLFKNPREKELSDRLSADSSTASSDDDDKKNPESNNNRKARSFSVNVPAPAELKIEAGDLPRLSHTPSFDWDTVRKAVEKAIKITDPKKHSKCDQALNTLSNGKITSLNALVSQYLNGTSLQHISDGRSTDAPGYGTDNPTVPAFVLGVGTSGANTYINSLFLNVPNDKNPAMLRAIAMIHEAVHQFGGMHDSDFDGSPNLTRAILDGCFPIGTSLFRGITL